MIQLPAKQISLDSPFKQYLYTSFFWNSYQVLSVYLISSLPSPLIVHGTNVISLGNAQIPAISQ
jgi:hypothetical protein